jgi:hypothetical protein
MRTAARTLHPGQQRHPMRTSVHVGQIELTMAAASGRSKPVEQLITDRPLIN